MDKRRRAYHDFRANDFCLIVPKNIVGGTLVFQKCSGTKNFLDNRRITILLNFFCLAVPKSFVGNP